MISKKIQNLFILKEDNIVEIYPNEYIIYIKKRDGDNILGFFTDWIVTCSSITISMNKDNICFFAHINEDNNLINVINYMLDKEIVNEKIDEVDIFYTNGIYGCKNEKINYTDLIEKIILIFIKKFNISKDKISTKMKTHKISTSVLKLIKLDNGKINYLNNMKDYTKKKWESIKN